MKNCKGTIKEFQSWRSECYHLVSANQGIVCQFCSGISNIDHSALETTILVGSLQGRIQKVKKG